MPKRKISLEEAFAAFEQHGLEVEVKGVVNHDVTTSDASDSFEVAETPAQQLPIGKGQKAKYVTVTLHASHMVGCGGMTDANDRLISAGSHEQYGPGVCKVPVAIAQHLLHQDQLARQADARFLEREQRNYIIMPHGGGGVGRLLNVGGELNFMDAVNLFGSRNVLFH